MELRFLNDQVGVMGGQLASLGGLLAGIGVSQGIIISSLTQALSYSHTVSTERVHGTGGGPVGKWA